MPSGPRIAPKSTFKGKRPTASSRSGGGLRQDADGSICGLELAAAEDIGEQTAGDIEELVPEPLNGGQANALTTKIENAVAKAAKGNYQAAINQMQAFIGQLGDMLVSGTLTADQAAPLIEEAQALIAIWTEEP